MGDDDAPFSMETQLGTLSVKVQGDDREEVSEEFHTTLDRMLDEAAEMSRAVRDGSRGCV